MESINIISNNVFFAIYAIVFFYLITPNKVSKLKDIGIYILSCLVIVFPYTIKLQEYILFNFISNSRYAGAFVAPIEELTKLIPLLILILYKRNEKIKVSDFIFVGAVSGIIFTMVENLFYFRCAEIGIIPIGSVKIEYLDYYIEFSHIIATTIISGLIGMFVTYNKNKLYKILWGIGAIIFTVYQVFEHYFYNHTVMNSFLGVIGYDKNEFLPKIHEITGQNKFTIVILIALIVYAYWSELGINKGNKTTIKEYIKNNRGKFILLSIAVACFAIAKVTYVHTDYIFFLEGLKNLLDKLFEPLPDSFKSQIDASLSVGLLLLLSIVSQFNFKDILPNVFIWLSNSKLGVFAKEILGDKAYYNTIGILFMLFRIIGATYDICSNIVKPQNNPIEILNDLLKTVRDVNSVGLDEYMKELTNNDFKEHITSDIRDNIHIENIVKSDVLENTVSYVLENIDKKKSLL